MLFVFDCRDREGHQRVRLDNRDAHLEYLESFGDKVVAAGPTLSDDGQSMTGSLLILDFENLAMAEKFAEDDPYAKAGLFESVSIRPWKKVLPRA